MPLMDAVCQSERKSSLTEVKCILTEILQAQFVWRKPQNFAWCLMIEGSTAYTIQFAPAPIWANKCLNYVLKISTILRDRAWLIA